MYHRGILFLACALLEICVVVHSLFQECYDTNCMGQTYVCTDNACTLICYDDNSCQNVKLYCNGTAEVDQNGFCKVECRDTSSCEDIKIYSEYRDFSLDCDRPRACKESSVTVVSDASRNFSIRSDIRVGGYTQNFQDGNYTCIGSNIQECNLYLNDTTSSTTSSRGRWINFHCDSAQCTVYCPTDSTNCGDQVCMCFNVF